MKAKLYRKLPVIVEVMQYDGTDESAKMILKWEGNKAIRYFPDMQDPIHKLTVKTLEGVMGVSKGDYIVKGAVGELYPCKPDAFLASFEEYVNNARNPDGTPFISNGEPMKACKKE